jgi:hypothetical protein
LFTTCRYNISSQTGQNIRFLLDKHTKVAMGDLVAKRITLKKLRVYPLPEEENWKKIFDKRTGSCQKGNT